MTFLARLLMAEKGKPRGVAVYTGETAEFYPTADSWVKSDKEDIELFDSSGRQIALFIHDTWLRVEAGPYVAPSEKQAVAIS